MKKENLKKKVYDDVLRAIIEGEYSAEDIISEAMLIEKYNVSKSPVREALVQLCGENVLKSIPRCGYMVVKLWRPVRCSQGRGEAQLQVFFYNFRKAFCP